MVLAVCGTSGRGRLNFSTFSPRGLGVALACNAQYSRLGIDVCRQYFVVMYSLKIDTRIGNQPHSHPVSMNFFHPHPIPIHLTTIPIPIPSPVDSCIRL